MPMQNTVNINPEKPTKLDMETIHAKIKENFKTHLKTSTATVFTHKSYEITLFQTGRMLKMSRTNKQTAIKVYTEIKQKISLN